MATSFAPVTRDTTSAEFEAQRRADTVFERRIRAALDQARAYVDAVAPSPAQPLDSIDVCLEETVEQLQERLASSTGLEAADYAEMTRLAFELLALNNQYQKHVFSQRLRALGMLQQLSPSVGDSAGVEKLLHRAAMDACDTCNFDRILIFRLDETHLAAQAAYFRGHEAWACDARDFARAHPIALDRGRFESEVLRRRTAGLVLDPRDDPKANHPIVTNTQSFSYASAPIVSGGVAIGTVHGDMHFSGRRVDVVDRDSLGAFAATLGSLLEKALLVDRLYAQRDRARALLRASEDLIREFSDGDIRMGSSAPASPGPEAGDPPYADSPLSGREREVLALLAGGATNAAIARRLVLSEGTVKSHVKRIFRKLRVGNRAEAAAWFTRFDGHPHSPGR
ncbi:LuxR C-terminal-related transcriptional regulator [Pseudonocardia spinosispora]|uniref:LuxR C-terminal-related transcriptional regulator n=1 Tax=Pseudonocardia spinosispora TaxID=103441 RepID=UPI00048EAEC4|nr:LuxR C-terminal-related transcriptional regulator [Pseudonocardia spinosispora]